MPTFLEKIRYWTYNRQSLDQRAGDINQALKTVIGVYSSHPSGPLSLAARVMEFEPKEFYDLEGSRAFFRVPAMRKSIYLLPRTVAQHAKTACLPLPDDPFWEKQYGPKGRGIPTELYPNWRKQVLAATPRPCLAAEIKGATDIPGELVKATLNRMTFEGDLLRLGSDNIRSNLIRYVATEAWAPDDFPQVEKALAQSWLAGEYLQAFGPARVKDFQWWAGISAQEARIAIDSQRHVAVEGDYLLLASDLAAFETTKGFPGDRISFLPKWDCYTMGYAPDGRDRFIDPALQERLYGKIGATGGNAFGAILVNGLCVAVWTSRFAGSKLQVDLDLFESPGTSLRADIRQGFEEVATLLQAKSLLLKEAE